MDRETRAFRAAFPGHCIGISGLFRHSPPQTIVPGPLGAAQLPAGRKAGDPSHAEFHNAKTTAAAHAAGREAQFVSYAIKNIYRTLSRLEELPLVVAESLNSIENASTKRVKSRRWVMFEAIVVRRAADADLAFDAGRLAEALLFYQNVHLLLDRDALQNALQVIGAANLIRLLESGNARATFVKQAIAATTDQVGMLEKHRFVEYELHGHGRELRTKLEVIEDCVERAIGKGADTSVHAKRLNELIPWRNLSEGVREKGGLSALALNDLCDPDYCRLAIETVLREFVPEYELPKGFHFSVYHKAGQFFVGTNLNLGEINRAYSLRWGTAQGPFSVPYLANHIFDARADFSLACQYSAEMMTTPITSQLIQLRISDWAHRRVKSAEELQLFQAAHLEDGRALKEAINSKERTFSDFLDLLDKSAKFKSMLRGANPDRGLAQEYFLASTRDTWVDRLPAKGFRFVFFTGGGLLTDLVLGGGVGTAAGLGLSLFDSFAIDKLIRGWKPNHFVDGPLRSFVLPRAKK